MKQKKEAEVPKNRQLLSMAIELAAQSERLVLLNEVGCVDDVIQVEERNAIVVRIVRRMRVIRIKPGKATTRKK